MMPATYYPAVIDRSESGYGVTFPDFPGCIAAGDTISEAAVNAELALGLHVEGMAKDGDSIPDPSDLGDIEPVDGADDVARLLVRVDRPVKVARVLVSIDEALLRQIDAVASNRSAFMAEAARGALISRVAIGSKGAPAHWVTEAAALRSRSNQAGQEESGPAIVKARGKRHLRLDEAAG